MSWGAQIRSKDAKTPSVGRGMSQNPEPDCRPVQPYHRGPPNGTRPHRIGSGAAAERQLSGS
jgi:hypothetical protein